MESLLKAFGLVGVDVPMIAIGTVFFFIFWKLAHRLIFANFMRLLETREAATTGAEQAAQEMQEQARRINEEVESRLFETRLQAMSKKSTQINHAKAQANKIIEEAESKAQEQLRDVRWNLMQNVDKLRAEALKDAENMSDLIVEKIVAQTGTGASLN